MPFREIRPFHQINKYPRNWFHIHHLLKVTMKHNLQTRQTSENKEGGMSSKQTKSSREWRGIATR